MRDDWKSDGREERIEAEELLDLKENEEKHLGAPMPEATPEKDFTKREEPTEEVKAPSKRGGELVRRREKERLVRRDEERRDRPKTEAEIPTEEKEEPSRESAREPSRHEGWYRVWLAALFPILTVLLAAGVMLAALSQRKQEDVSQSDETAPPEKSEERVIFVREYDADSGILTTPEIYEKCAGSVVSIVGAGEEGTGIGSGFFLTEDGYVATANHVVEGRENLSVVLSDGRSYSARLVSGNAFTDLALLKIEGEEFPSVEIGSSAKLLTGDRVVAIGTPAALDYAGSVSTGDVSYRSRRVKIYGADGVLEKKMTLLQTNAPVNPGNSGCPLFNEYGAVIGIVTMKLSSSYAGIGFAIPIDGALPILRSMMAGNEPDESLLSAVSTSAPKLGILGEKGREGEILGVRVVGFSPEYGEAASILEEGDLIIGIDHVPVADGDDVAALISDKEPKDRVSVTVLRGGQRLTFLLTLGS